MRSLLLTLVILFATQPVYARGVPGAGTFNLVPAQCPGSPPAVLPGPCAPDFTFTKGTVTLLGSKQPKPTCPKTSQPADSPAGSVKMSGVASGGTPFSGTLSAAVTFTATFAVDANSNCDLRGVQIPAVPSLGATITCTSGRCKGTFLPAACLPKQCADGLVTTELGTIEIKNGDTVVARPGTVLLPQATDAP